MLWIAFSLNGTQASTATPMEEVIFPQGSYVEK